jgi:hypothetical protein
MVPLGPDCRTSRRRRPSTSTTRAGTCDSNFARGSADSFRAVCQSDQRAMGVREPHGSARQPHPGEVQEGLPARQHQGDHSSRASAQLWGSSPDGRRQPGGHRRPARPHTDLATTQIYAKVQQEHLRTVIGKLNGCCPAQIPSLKMRHSRGSRRDRRPEIVDEWEFREGP